MGLVRTLGEQRVHLDVGMQRNLSSLAAELGGRFEAVEAISRQMQEVAGRREAIEDFFRRGAAFVDMVIRMRWPPPSHLPASLADEITEAHSRGEVSDTEVAGIFVELYDADMLEAVIRSWRSYEWLEERIQILEEGVSNHVEARYFSSVCTLLPQIEGALGIVLPRTSPKNAAEKIFGSTRLPTAAKKFYVDIVWDSAAPIPELSRNKILHGSAVAYGTAVHSLKVILVLDAVLSALDTFRR